MAQKDVSFTIRAKDEASAAIKETKKQLGELKDAAVSMAAGIAAALGAVGLGEFFKSSIMAAAEAEAAWSRMGVAVQNARGDFKAFQPEAERVIDLLSGKTKGMFEKDSMAAALEKLIEVSGNAKGSLGALPIVLDLARAKHMDLESAATLVGRVMTGNTSMLKRYGVVVDETKDAMAQLADKFKGFAEKDATTMLGTIDRMSVAWAEFKQAVGKALTADSGEAGEGVIGFLAKLERGITANEKAISHMIAPFKDIAAFFGSVFVATLKAVGSGLATLWISAEGLTSGLVIGVGKLAEGLGKLVQLVPGLREVGKELKEWGANASTAAKDDFTTKWREYVGMYDGANRGGTAKATGTIPGPPPAALSKGDETALKSLADAIRHLGEETADGKTKAQQFAEKMDEIRRKMEVTKGVTDAMWQSFYALNEALGRIKDAEAADAFRQLGEAILETTGDAVSKATAEMSKKLDELRKASAKVTNPAEQAAYAAQVERLNALYGVQLNTLKLIEESQRISGDAERSHSGPGSLIAERQRIGSALTTEEILHGRTTKAAKDLRAEYDRLTQSILQMRNAAIDGASSLASGILSAGNALGIFDQKAQTMLGSVISLASEMQKLSALSESGSLFDLAASGGAWGAAIGAVGSLLGAMFGTSPEVAQALKVQMQNTEALHKLSDTLHSTGLSVSGRDLNTAQQQLAKLGAFRTGDFGITTDLTKTGLKEFFAANGLDSTLLHSVAASFGMTIDDTLGSYRRLADAVEIASGRIAKFGGSFGDLTTEYDAYAKIFNITDPVELLKLHAQAATEGPNGSATIRGIFAGADPSTASGQADLQKRIQDTLLQMMHGGAGIDLGGMTRDQFLGVLESLSSDLQGLTKAVQENTRMQYGVPAGLHVSLEQYRAAAQWTAPTATSTPSTTAGNSGGSVVGASGGAAQPVIIQNTITLDGKVVAKSVVKTLEATSARVNGDTTEWSSITSGAI